MVLYTEKDGAPLDSRDTNPYVAYFIPRNWVTAPYGDDIIYISEGAGRWWKAVGNGGVDTLRVDYSKVKTSHGVRWDGGATLILGESWNIPSTPRIQYSGITKLEITGTSLDDQLPNGGGDDIILAGAGNDTLLAGNGKDILDGGSGVDYLEYRSYDSDAKTFNSTGVITLPNGTTISGIERFRITTGVGNDTVKLNGRINDYIYALGGDDTIDSGLGTDIVEGGTLGNDLLIVDYSSVTQGIQISDLVYHTSTSYSGKLYAGNPGSFKSAIDSIGFSSIEQLNITGSKYADNLRNQFASDDTLLGNGGDDTIGYGGGADIIDGGDGQDTLSLELQSSRSSINLVNLKQGGGEVTNSSKKATFKRMERLNAITGGGADSINWRGGGNDSISTNSGIDTIISGGGNDTLDGGNSSDTLTGVDPDSVNPGTDEIDIITGGPYGDPDSFNLGDADKKYYFDSSNVTGLWKDDNDYAFITDFSSNVDKIILNGGPSDYYLIQNQYLPGFPALPSKPNTLIIAEKDGKSGFTDKDDVIGVLHGAVGLNLNANYFQYVGTSHSNLSFSIKLPGLTGFSTLIQSAILKAKDKWEKVIQGYRGQDGSTLGGEYEFTSIKYDTGIPSGVRAQGIYDLNSISSSTRLPTKGQILVSKVGPVLDPSRLDPTPADYWYRLFLHEMGHALGLNSRIYTNKEFSNFLGSKFTGPNALREYKDLSAEKAATFVPLAGSHWSFPTGGLELMIAGEHRKEILSRITIGAFEDIGYAVNYNEAEPFELIKPTISVKLPSPTIFENEIIPGSTVNAIISDPAGLSNIDAKFDINGDGVFSAVNGEAISLQSLGQSQVISFPNVSGPLGTRLLTISASDSFGNTAIEEFLFRILLA